ncbi:2Fe-2S iron-sulfur cluster-binding protein [Halioxenophilus aromaticivorans]|uniref:2Fe-2S iron-sulfur cluster-binding protein n=1 Tax=Halioxenophilus aromaticivorans TaxID=1306992 RepID=A0AAV3TX51_9ALTE
MKVTYVSSEGDETVIDLKGGVTIQEGAIQNLVDGIDADCGGGMSCATCHVFVDSKWVDRVGPPTALESDMLSAIPGSNETSRLSCQISMSSDLDGLVVHMPEEQYGY